MKRMKTPSRELKSVRRTGLHARTWVEQPGSQQQWTLGSPSGMGWDWDALLQAVHRDPPLLEWRRTAGSHDTGVPVHWGRLWTTRDNETEKPSCHFWRTRSKSRYIACPLHTPPPEGRASHLSHPSGPTPGHTPQKGAAQPLSAPGVSKQGHLSLALVAHLAPAPLQQQGPQ